MLTEVDLHQKEKERAHELYGIICTILINIISFEEIDFIGEIKSDLASPVITNIKIKEREVDTIWFIANVLYRRNNFSKHFMLMLVRNDVAGYLRKRMGLAFAS